MGFVAIDDGSAVRILPEAVAAQDGAVGLSSGGSGDEMTTRVLELKHVNPNEIISVLRPLIPQTGQMLAHPPSNSIIVSDRVSNVQRLEAIVRRLDVASQSEIEVVSLGSANAAELVRTLTQLSAGAPEAGGKVAADERTNSIILSGDRARRLRMKALIAVLDTPLRTDDSAQVIYLSYAKAEDVAAILDAMVKGGSLEAVAAASAPGQRGRSGRCARFRQPHADPGPQGHQCADHQRATGGVPRVAGHRAQARHPSRPGPHRGDHRGSVRQHRQGTRACSGRAPTTSFGDNGFIGGTNFPGTSGSWRHCWHHHRPHQSGGFGAGWIGSEHRLPARHLPPAGQRPGPHPARCIGARHWPPTPTTTSCPRHRPRCWTIPKRCSASVRKCHS